MIPYPTARIIPLFRSGKITSSYAGTYDSKGRDGTLTVRIVGAGDDLLQVKDIRDRISLLLRDMGRKMAGHQVSLWHKGADDSSRDPETKTVVATVEFNFVIF